MPLPAVVICKTVAVVAAFGISAFLAIYHYKNNYNTYNNSNNNNGSRDRDGATRSTSETSSMKNDTNDKSTWNTSRLRKTSSSKLNNNRDITDIPQERGTSRSRKNSVTSSEDVCAICLEDFDNAEIITLICKHNLHYRCAVTWFEESGTCPLCRTTRPE